MSISIKTANKNKFLDIYDNDDYMRITDYCLLDKKIIVNKDENTITFGDRNNRIKITSIEEMKKCFEELIEVSLSILCKNSVEYIGFDAFQTRRGFGMIDYKISIEERKLVVEQLVFDILYDKYKKESVMMSCSEYAIYMGNLLADGGISLASVDAIRKSVQRSMEQHYEMMKYSDLKEELMEMGVDPDQYVSYYNPVISDNINRRKPKFIWDQLYYNHRMITYRQYRRKLTQKNRNYSYERIVEDFKEYDSFLKKLLPVENESVKKFFEKSMDYYHLETYKRIDFLFYLEEFMSKVGITKMDEVRFLIKRFHPKVLVPYLKEDKLDFTEKINYYRPLLMLEKMLLNKIEKNNYEDDLRKIGIQLFKCQIIRAKAYELFKYHAEYISSDYKEIKEYIKKAYNMRSYNNDRKKWENLNWKDIEREEKKELKRHIKNFISINDILFWESSKRKISVPEEK